MHFPFKYLHSYFFIHTVSADSFIRNMYAHFSMSLFLYSSQFSTDFFFNLMQILYADFCCFALNCANISSNCTLCIATTKKKLHYIFDVCVCINVWMEDGIRKRQQWNTYYITMDMNLYVLGKSSQNFKIWNPKQFCAIWSEWRSRKSCNKSVEQPKVE